MNLSSSPIQNQIVSWLMRRTPTTGVRRVISLAAAIASEIGSVRGENQDRAVVAHGRDKQGKGYTVVVVADGIGGMREGSTCAAIAIGAFLSTLDRNAQTGTGSSESWVRSAVIASNQEVFSKFRGDGGSTLVAILVRSGHPSCWMSVGDSRVYSATGKSLIQISVDDTIAGQLGKVTGIMSEQSNLLQFIGMGDELEPHIATIESDSVNAVVLTTDGVHYLSSAPGWLGQIVGNAPDPGVCVKRLVDLAKWCGGHDNATAAIISLSTDQELECAIEYPCLEIWDAFGEIQIISNITTLGKLSSNDFPTLDKMSAADANIVAPKNKIASEVEPENLKQEKKLLKSKKDTKVKNVVKAKGSSRKTSKYATQLPVAELPQLLMEFPTKSN